MALYGNSPPIFETIELNWLDLRFRARGATPPGQAVVIAAIDEKSLAQEGRWPWPRSRIAALVEALNRDGAKVIGFDVVFAEAERDPRLQLIDDLEDAVGRMKTPSRDLVRLLGERRKAADQDAVLTATLEGSSVPVVLGYFLHMDEASVGFPIDAAEVERRFAAIAESRYPAVFRHPQGEDRFLRAFAPQGNIASVTKAAASSGYFSVASDPDGVLRWVPLMVQGGEDLYPPLTVLTVWHYLDMPTLAVHAGQYGVDGVQIGDRFVPTDEWGRMFVNYRGGARTFPTHSVADILAGRLPAGTFRDRIVIVGATATSLGDIRTTPFGPLYPGPEVHASAIDNILAGDFIERPRWRGIIDLSAIVALAALLGTVLPRATAYAGLAFSALLAAGYVLLAYWLFVEFRVALTIVYAVFTIGATYTFLTLHRYLTEERERRYIKSAFQHYVAPEVIELMLEKHEDLRLGGEERVLTALFSDLEGFTTFSEKRAPNEVISVLGEYYAAMTEEVFKVNGTLVEYVGDELYAIFGAPVAQPDHARRACEAALAMQATRKAINAEWAKLGRPPIKARTGINTGLVLVGNVGSKYRFHYGAMGDTVNLASRLEGLGKVYGTQMIISENTAEQLGDAFRLRELDLVRVKGRQQALRIYELLGKADHALTAEQEELFELYRTGLDAYRQRAWGDAAQIFKRCQLRFPEDGPARLMERRCRIYLEAPPSLEWGGAFEDRRGGHLA